MVYGIRPRANRANRVVELEYRRSPTAQCSWLDYMRKEQAVPRENAPSLILSEHGTPLPDAFEINRDIWCVSDKVRDLMQGLFGSQVAFYEVPVVVKADNTALPSTNFVTFSRFRDLIDWQKSMVQAQMPSALFPDVEVVRLADAVESAVFKAMPAGQQMIWIERTFREGNRLYSPGFNVYATNAAVQRVDEAFPGAFALRKHREHDPRSSLA